MVGEILVVIWLLIAVPVGVMVTGAVIAAVIGWALRDNGEATHEGSELIALND
jgi:multisubunit Na+/H+ antiporter MnhE subunit